VRDEHTNMFFTDYLSERAEARQYLHGYRKWRTTANQNLFIDLANQQKMKKNALLSTPLSVLGLLLSLFVYFCRLSGYVKSFTL